MPPHTRITLRATLEVIKFITRVYPCLPASKTLPRAEDSDIRKEAVELVARDPKIANINVIARILLLYKRCMDRDSMIVTACLGQIDDLRAVILIKLGRLDSLADQVLQRVASSALCTKGRWYKQFCSVLTSIQKEVKWRGFLRTWSAHYFSRLARALPYFLAEKEAQIGGNERQFTALRMLLRDTELQRWSRQPPATQPGGDRFGKHKFPVKDNLQSAVTQLADEVRRRTAGPTVDGVAYGAESMLHQLEEEAFTVFCGVLSPNGLDTSLLVDYKMFPPGSRTAQCLYYISGYACHRMARYSMKTAKAFDFEKRDMLMHLLFWSFECARHRASTNGDVDDAAAARAAGVPDDLVAAVVRRRQTARGESRRVVMATMPLYRLITLLELNCRKRLTVGALCANPTAVDALERDLKADPLVQQEFRRTLRPVTLVGRLACSERSPAAIEDSLISGAQETAAEDSELLLALEMAERQAAGCHSDAEPPTKRRTVMTDFSAYDRERGGPAILAAIIRLFVHVRGRDTVRSIMARRDVYSKEASSVSLRGSIAVVTKRLNEHVKKLAAKAKAQSDAIPAAMPTQSLPDHDPDRVAHHAEADGVDEDGEVPLEYLESIDRALAEAGEDDVVALLKAGGDLYPVPDS